MPISSVKNHVESNNSIPYQHVPIVSTYYGAKALIGKINTNFYSVTSKIEPHRITPQPSTLRCIILLIPVFGNLCVFLYDLTHRPQTVEMTAQQKMLKKVTEGIDSYPKKISQLTKEFLDQFPDSTRIGELSQALNQAFAKEEFLFDCTIGKNATEIKEFADTLETLNTKLDRCVANGHKLNKINISFIEQLRLKVLRIENVSAPIIKLAHHLPSRTFNQLATASAFTTLPCLAGTVAFIAKSVFEDLTPDLDAGKQIKFLAAAGGCYLGAYIFGNLALKLRDIQKKRFQEYMQANSHESAIGQDIFLALPTIPDHVPHPPKGIFEKSPVIFKEISTISDFNNAIFKCKASGQKIKGIWMCCHGSPQQLWLANPEESNDPNDIFKIPIIKPGTRIDENAVKELIPALQELEKDAFIVLEACNAGKSLNDKHNIAQMIAQIAGGRTIYCPDQPCSPNHTEIIWSDSTKVKFDLSLIHYLINPRNFFRSKDAVAFRAP